MSKKKLYLLSLIITIACAFIPYPYSEKEIEYLTGLPAQVFGFYFIEKFHFSFLWLGFIFNYFVFYFLLRLIILKLFSKFFGIKNL